MKPKWIFMVLAGFLICSIFCPSQGADKFYFGSWGGKEHAYMLKDSLRFNIIGCLMDPSDIDSIANTSLRVIVHPKSGQDHPTHWAWNSHYTLWEAEPYPGSNVNLQYNGGTLVDDPSASGGKAMKFTGTGTPGLIQWGPSYYQEDSLWGDAIEYTVEFRLKYHYNLYTPPGPPTPVCSLMVVDTVSHSVLKDTVLYKSDFPGSGIGGYGTFELMDYTVPDNNRIEFQIHWCAPPEAVNFWIDYVKVYDGYGKDLMSGAWDAAIIDYVSQSWTKTVNEEGDTVIYRWCMRDEPPSIDFYAPTRYIDGLLKTVSQERVGFQAVWRFENPDEAHEYLLRQNPKDICFDILPMDDFGHDTTGSAYQQVWYSKVIQHLNFTKTVSDSLNKDFWLIPQVWTCATPYTGPCDYDTFTWHDTLWCAQQRDPSRYEVRLQTFLGMCYGTDAILYFLYNWWKDDGNLLTGLYDSLNNYKTEKWREIKEFTGPRVEKLGPILNQLTWQGAGFYENVDTITGSFIDSLKPAPGETLLTTYVQVGFLKDDADTDYFMLVNR